MRRLHLTRIILVGILVLIGIAGRLLPHVWNATPVTAIALFASYYIGWRYSSAAVFGIMLASDFFLGFYAWPIMLAVYAGFAAAVCIGHYIRHYAAKSPIAILAGSLGSSLLFFIITNWAVWQFGTMYAHTFAGLADCYMMALPFFRNTLAGDIAYTSVFFGAYELVLAARTSPAKMMQPF